MKNKIKENNPSKDEMNEAYHTLVEWTKSVPDAMEKIKRTGTKEDLVKYKKQIRLIVEKMKEIEKRLKP